MVTKVIKFRESAGSFKARDIKKIASKARAFMVKSVVFCLEARGNMMKGLNILADAVKIRFSPENKVLGIKNYYLFCWFMNICARKSSFKPSSEAISTAKEKLENKEYSFWYTKNYERRCFGING